jgi:hypothetical protein
MQKLSHFDLLACLFPIAIIVLHSALHCLFKQEIEVHRKLIYDSSPLIWSESQVQSMDLSTTHFYDSAKFRSYDFIYRVPSLPLWVLGYRSSFQVLVSFNSYSSFTGNHRLLPCFFSSRGPKSATPSAHKRFLNLSHFRAKFRGDLLFNGDEARW